MVVHLRECLRRHIGAGFHQHFEPHTETIGIELFVPAWLGRSPQVEVENTRQLAWCRQRDELAAILESTVLNHTVKDLGRQSRDDVHEVRRFEDAIEQAAPVPALSFGWTVALTTRAARAPCRCDVRATTSGTDRFRHAPGDDTGPGGQQTVLNGGRR